MQTGQKLLFIVRVTLATILLCVAFIRPASSQSSPDQPYDLYMPLVNNGLSALPEIQNGDFEGGDNGDWTVYSLAEYTLIQEENLPGWLTPHSGSWLAWMGGLADEDSRISQSVTLPPGGPAYLRYYYQVDSLATPCDQDWMRFQVGATELASLGLCESSNTTSWAAGAVDLSAYAGQTFTITFQVTTDPAGEGSSFFIDDVFLSRNP
jgi:hypothetical protein